MSTHTAPTALHIHIREMDCAAEEAEVRRALDALPGVVGLRFDLRRRVLSAQLQPGSQAAELAPPMLSAIRGLGYTPQLLQAPEEARRAPETGCCENPASGCGTAAHGHAHAHDHHGDEHHGHHHAQAPSAAPAEVNPLPRLLLALALALTAEGLHDFGGEAALWRYLGLAVAVGAVALSGLGTYRKGWQALRQGRLNINALMAVAVTGAIAIGSWPEAAMVMSLYALAELIEGRSVERARNAIRTLLALSPPDAEVLQADGRWLRQPVGEIALGQTVRLRPGERAALDGQVLRGHSALDQSPITGESLPVDKGPGDAVYAGSINQQGELELRATALAQDSLLARIIEAVEQAQASRAPTQRFVDRFAAVYTPAVFVLALGVAVGAPLLLGWGWLEAAYQALVLLVIACPCALVIATPVTIVSGLTAAARRGLLFKGGLHLEQARRLRAMALDKTGTLTQGRPELVAAELWREGASAAQVHALAHALAQRSDHPVSQAIAQGLGSPTPAPLPELEQLQALPGCGLTAQQRSASGLQTLQLGQVRWISATHALSPAQQAQLHAHEAAGRSVSLLADAQGLLACYAVADTLRPHAREALQALQRLGVHTVMLTGDNTRTAQAIAQAAGVATLRAELLPQDKLQALQQLRQQLGPIGMVGDGINDAPALAGADLGFAMGGAGTDTAMEAADVVIMTDDLRRLPEAIALSRRTHTLLWQNISLALGIKAAFMAAALLGQAHMWMAVVADVGASLLVVANGLRVLRWRGPWH
ncbi:heavy metal translocating P-type ATPase [Roseateles sp. BYS180W]|uniref:P-type Zn(2+) transporter n=1 Tax=Roseateles rivi TaxID=3299028 RepID=A0ABW7FQN8_9BURK